MACYKIQNTIVRPNILTVLGTNVGNLGDNVQQPQQTDLNNYLL